MNARAPSSPSARTSAARSSPGHDATRASARSGFGAAASLRRIAFANPAICGPPTRFTALTASSTAANAGTRKKKICSAATHSAPRASHGRLSVGFLERASSSATIHGSTRSVP